MKRIVAALIATMVLAIATPTMAAIQYGDQTYTAPFAASTTQQVGNLVNGVNIPNPSTDPISAIQQSAGIISGIKYFFTSVDAWLKEHAGIDFFSILMTIGHWFVLTLEWILKALKAIL